MLKWWRVPPYPDWINEENTIIWLVTLQIQISSWNFQIFKFKTNFCVCRFLLQNVFLKLINIFFFVFILVDAFSGSKKTDKTQKIFLPCQKIIWAKENFICEILFVGTRRAVPGGQYRSILPARVANQNTEFAAYNAYNVNQVSSSSKELSFVSLP